MVVIAATLRGGLDFRVIPPDPQMRTVTKTSASVVWEWTVVPRRPGNKALIFDFDFGPAGDYERLRRLGTLTGHELSWLQTFPSEEIRIRVGVLRWVASTFSGHLGIALGLVGLVMIIAGLSALIYLRPGSVAEVLWGQMPPGSRPKLRAAILSGFDHVSLDQVLRDNDMNHASIATGPDFEEHVDSLIEVARQQGWLNKLCDVLAAARSGNPDVSSAILAVRKSLTDRSPSSRRRSRRAAPRPPIGGVL